jgi:hypothetical protein
VKTLYAGALSTVWSYNFAIIVKLGALSYFFEKIYIYFSFFRFYPKFQQVAKNIEACQIIFLISYFLVAKSG